MGRMPSRTHYMKTFNVKKRKGGADTNLSVTYNAGETGSKGPGNKGGAAAASQKYYYGIARGGQGEGMLRIAIEAIEKGEV